jgi:hypothetical protein
MGFSFQRLVASTKLGAAVEPNGAAPLVMAADVTGNAASRLADGLFGLVNGKLREAENRAERPAVPPSNPDVKRRKADSRTGGRAQLFDNSIGVYRQR